MIAIQYSVPLVFKATAAADRSYRRRRPPKGRRPLPPDPPTAAAARTVSANLPLPGFAPRVLSQRNLQ